MKIKKYTIYFCVLGLLASVALLIYGVTGPHFRSEPLVSSFTFSSSNPQSFTFNVDRTDKYMIEVRLKKVFLENEMDSILGDFVAGGKGGTINVVWEIKEGNKIVTKGSNIDFGYSPIFSSGYSGLTIGEFNAISGVEYILSLYVKSVNPEWDQCKPYVEVGLHPAKLEYLLVYQIFGIMLFVTFSGILGIVFLVYVVQKRRNVKNKISA